MSDTLDPRLKQLLEDIASEAGNKPFSWRDAPYGISKFDAAVAHAEARNAILSKMDAAILTLGVMPKAAPPKLGLIRENIFLVDSDVREVKRTWRERLFTLPWQPFKATRTEITTTPSKVCYQMPDGSLVMHPATAAELKRQLGLTGETK